MLTPDVYLHVESAYVEAVRTLLDAAAVAELRVCELDIGNPQQGIRTSFDDGVSEFCSTLQNGDLLRGAQLEKAVRGGLRELMWCKLQSDSDAYVHFGYDFYGYIGVRISDVNIPLPALIYLEECPSPYDEQA